LSENGYFSQSLRQAQIIILEILECIHPKGTSCGAPAVIIFAFLDLEKTISFSDSLLMKQKIGHFLRDKPPERWGVRPRLQMRVVRDNSKTRGGGGMWIGNSYV